ncbi:MAG TPA: efflux RND transporter periplasmic adaptor subunit [Terriglobia bacterium]|nr:efflux RND transporter periplasmic adaptor subunit [Terriglobia bacterium]
MPEPQRLADARSSLAALAILMTTVLIGAACSSKETAETTPTAAVQVATVQAGTIKREVSADAVLYPLHQAAIVPKITAPVSEFYVQRGSHVRAGQLLARLESRDLAAAVTENQGTYEQAQASYQTAVKSDVPEALQKAKLDAKAAKDTFDAAQKVYTNDQTLYSQGAIPQKQLEDAGVALTQARNQNEIAQKHLEALEAFANQDALKAARGQLSSAQGRYDAAQAQLSYAEIKSPIDGVVTDRPLYPGEMATPGSPLLTIMDLSRVVARAHLPAAEAALVKVGDSASFEAPGVTEAVPARVMLVSPALDPGSTTVQVWVEAVNHDNQLKVGSTVHVTMVAEIVKNALLVPSSAVLTSPDGKTSVMSVGSDDVAHQTDVRLGIKEGDQVQVMSGLESGQKVVSEGAFGLPDGTKVKYGAAAGGESGKAPE